MDSSLRAGLQRPGRPPIRVRYSLLRNEPTVTGIAYPKYYLWACVFSGDSLERAGAIRVAAIHGAFELTHFIPHESIRADSAEVGSVFPRPLVAAILERAALAPGRSCGT